MNDLENFQFHLLSRMNEDYRSSLLHEIGLTGNQLREAEGKNSLNLPVLLKGELSSLVTHLGNFVSMSSGCGVNGNLDCGTDTKFFLLPLWPHLYWAVDVLSNDCIWNARFRNQHNFNIKIGDPSLIRRGVWTHSSLERVADRWEFYDGWDENVLNRYFFGEAVFEGALVFDLLQDWRRIK